MASFPALTVVLPAVAVLVGLVVYWDTLRVGREMGIAALLGFIVGGLFLAGSVPGLVALAVSEQSAAQGFPTAIRIIPGLAALVVYASFRRLGRPEP